jgi:monofunctional biosynthetic peptidoglycan transglycosylase
MTCEIVTGEFAAATIRQGGSGVNREAASAPFGSHGITRPIRHRASSTCSCAAKAEVDGKGGVAQGMAMANHSNGGRSSLARRMLTAVVLCALAAVAAPYVLAPLYRFGHPVSALIAWRWVTGAPVKRTWIDLPRIAPALPRTVVAAEDARFCEHRGVDWNALSNAIEDAQDGEPSFGGSTITQQVVKNLFLWPGRSVVRKGLEIPLALWVDLVLPKRRILEIYLNIAEWGPSGEFGAEAGARRAFGHAAAGLTAREAALMTAIQPNPKARSGKRPGPSVERRAALLSSRAGTGPDLLSCISVQRSR